MSGATEADLALWLRVEAAIRRLDARLSIRAAFESAGDGGMRWRELVAEWRECVQLHGPGSASARGVLLDLVREAWGPGCRVDTGVFAHGDARVEVYPAREKWVEFEGDTLGEALTVAMESAPS